MRRVPLRCDACGSIKIGLMKLERRRAENRKAWPYVYYCRSCQAETGCHEGTIFPFGRMACPRTRYMRAQAHKAFDKLWRKKDGITREGAYRQLAHHMRLTREECHIGMFTIKQCKRVIEFANETRRHMRKKGPKRR